MPMFMMVDGAPMEITPRSRSPLATGNINALDFGAMAFGPDAVDRYIIACIARQNAGAVPTSITIGGVAATIYGFTNGNFCTAFAGALIPAGASGHVVATFNINATRWACCVMSLTGWNGVNFNVDQVVNLNLPANSAIAAIGGGTATFISGPLPNFSWTGLTPDSYMVIQNPFCGANAASFNLANAETPHVMSVGITGANVGAGRIAFWN